MTPATLLALMATLAGNPTAAPGPLRKTPDGQLARPEVPKECTAQCQFLEDMGDQQCEGNLHGQGEKLDECKAIYKDIRGACLDSCKEKGQFDVEFIRSKLPKIQAKYEKDAQVRADKGKSDPRAGSTIEASKAKESERKAKEAEKAKAEAKAKEEAAKNPQKPKVAPTAAEPPAEPRPDLGPTRTQPDEGRP